PTRDHVGVCELGRVGCRPTQREAVPAVVADYVVRELIATCRGAGETHEDATAAVAQDGVRVELVVAPGHENAGARVVADDVVEVFAAVLARPDATAVRSDDVVLNFDVGTS